jgi:hypothetical protein
MGEDEPDAIMISLVFFIIYPVMSDPPLLVGAENDISI